MFLIVTRTFPPEVGGMQNLMWGLAKSLSKIDLTKVFADYSENHEKFDNKVSKDIGLNSLHLPSYLDLKDVRIF